MSSVLLAQTPLGAQREAAAPATPPVPPSPPAARPGEGFAARNPALTVLAGVGVLLLAMGVGVLIGRAGAAKQSAAPAQVITVAASGGSPAAGAASEAPFASDWPSATSGYTVQLQTLAQTGTAASAVEAAKSAASAKGAKSVGALKSEEFASLAAGSYVIYSGVYHKKAEAESALAGLRKSFPGAKVIDVSNGGSSSAGSGSSSEGSGSSSSSSPGSSENHPAPPSVLKSLKGAKGKSYVERSKNLPDVVETG